MFCSQRHASMLMDARLCLPQPQRRNRSKSANSLPGQVCATRRGFYQDNIRLHCALVCRLARQETPDQQTREKQNVHQGLYPLLSYPGVHRFEFCSKVANTGDQFDGEFLILKKSAGTNILGDNPDGVPQSRLSFSGRAFFYGDIRKCL